ncbi:hypothetical protein ACFLW4_03185 [Chloroflexota bacterium]
MKKKITKIWGVGLVLVMTVSLLFSAAPVSAGTLAWGAETLPSTSGNVLAYGTNILDIAVSADGTMYVAAGGNTLYKSTDDGATWSGLTTDNATDLVGVALDDSDIVAYADTTTNLVHVSINGGTTWGSLGTIQEGSGGDTVSSLSDLAVSPDSAGTNYVAVAGVDNATTGAVWYFNVGAAAPKWIEATSDSGIVSSLLACGAVAFSPNFASDEVMVTTAINAANVTFEIYSHNSDTWNTFDGYPVTIDVAATAFSAITAADIALAPDYLGSDDSLRIAFVAIDVNEATSDGIWRLKDTSVKDIKVGSGNDAYSVAFDGTNLVAGQSTSNAIWRCDDPLASTPTFSTASSLKRPGGTSAVVVDWNGADVVAGMTGNESAFATSKDNGKSFSDISLIDTGLTNLEDVAASADGSVVYLATDNGTGRFSLFRKADTWERVLSLATTGYIVRIAPEDPNSVYVAQQGSGNGTIYYSTEGGDTKWFQRTFRYGSDGIQDISVESSQVAYVALFGSTSVSKTTNGGFTWAGSKATKLTSGDIHSILSLGEDNVMVGSDGGYVAYSTDGYSTWTAIKKILETSATNVQVAASGLDDGDFIYAASNKTASVVVRWELGESTAWTNLSAPTDSTQWATGMQLVDGVLYVATANSANSSVMRTLGPTAATVTWCSMASDGESFTASPTALSASAGSTKLWAIDTVADDEELFVYTDTLADSGPTPSGPADGTVIAMNAVSGTAYSVSFSWERPSKAITYQLQVALDSGFNEKVYTPDSPLPSDTGTTSATVAHVAPGSSFMPDTTYYWRVRAYPSGAKPYSQFSEVRSFSIGSLPEVGVPVIIEQPPAPVISVPPTPEIIIQPPEVIVTIPEFNVPPAQVTLPPAPAQVAPIPSWALYVIIILGAILVIALIVLILRTRRPV